SCARPLLGASIVPGQTGRLEVVRESLGSPLWVKSRHRGAFDQSPLYPRKRTSELSRGVSALCQKQTFRCRRQSYRRVAPFAVLISGWWATPRPRVCDDRSSIAVFRHSIKHCSLNGLLKKPTAPLANARARYFPLG